MGRFTKQAFPQVIGDPMYLCFQHDYPRRREFIVQEFIDVIVKAENILKNRLTT